jgi:hypothetical protein
MSDKHYKQQWVKWYQKNLSELEEILTWDPFEKWSRNRYPTGEAEDNLRVGSQILYANGDTELARKFLHLTLTIAKRITTENKLESSLCCTMFPENRSRLLRVQTYAQALLGQEMDLDMLRQASADAMTWCRQDSSKRWHPVTEGAFMASLQTGLLAGERAQVCELLKLRSSLTFQQGHYDVLRRLIEAEPDQVFQDAALVKQFERFFDKVRNPRFSDLSYVATAVLRLELGALRDLFFVSRNRIIDWARVIKAISE